MGRTPFRVVAVFALAACLAGCEQTADHEASRNAPDSTGGLTEEQRRELERIATLGYVTEGDPIPQSTGVTVHGDDAFDGYTVYVSRDHAGAFVVDMDGRTVHSWFESEPENWTRACVYADGSVLGISSHPARLVKLDPDSREVWTYGGINLKAHHDVRVEPEGRIYALVRHARVIPWFQWDGGMNDDLIVVLEPNGDSVVEVDRVSILEAFRESEYAELLSEPWFLSNDPLHANSIEVLDGRIAHPAFCSGNILLSLRNIDALAVLDLNQHEIVWFNRGLWQRQHEARVTDEGLIILFDNRKHDGQSRVVEYDVLADEIVWSYTSEGFYSSGAGAQQRLRNDNTLITESQKGRVFEISRDGRVVWDYISPRRHRGGDTVVRVPRAFRLPHGYFTSSFRERLRQESAGRSRAAGAIAVGRASCESSSSEDVDSRQPD